MLPVLIGCVLTFDPLLTVLKNFFLPDWHCAFQFTNGPFAGFKSCLPMRCTHGDNHARFTDRQAANAMYDTDVGDRKFLVGLFAQTFQLF